MSAMAATAAHLLVVDDDQDLLRLLTMRLHAWGYRVSTAASAEEGLARIAVEPPQLVLSDIRLPGKDGLALFDEIRATRPTLPVVLLTAHGTIPDAVDAMSRGVFGYLTKPFDSNVLREKIEQALQLSPAGETPQAGQDEAWRAGLVFRSSRMAELIEEARVVAASDASVLIRGESGTGKEVLARAIHRASPRSGKPFVAINCGAIPEQLLESELFGHVKGSFTGAATAHTGLFQAANGGTLFLDEVGDLPASVQVKLLRVIQERQVVRLGSRKPIPIDVRLIAGTNVDLEKAVLAGRFRLDLFYRLNVAPVVIPPLRERRGDIPPLVQFFVDYYSQKLRATPPPRLSIEAAKLLELYQWPGNIRELENVIHFALIICQNNEILPGDLRLPNFTGQVTNALPETCGPTDPESTLGGLRIHFCRLLEAGVPNLVEEVERVLYSTSFDYCRANQVRTARDLGISRNVLRSQLKRFGLIGEAGEAAPAEFDRHAPREMVRQQRDILLARAQRRQRHHLEAQPVEQVGAKPALLRHEREILVGRGNDPHVDPDRTGRADPRHLAIFDRAQQAFLGAHRQGRQFVEE